MQVQSTRKHHLICRSLWDPIDLEISQSRSGLAYFNGVDWRLLVELVFEALLALGTEFENPSIDSISYKQKKSRCMDENRLDEPNHLHLFLSLARVRIWKEISAREVQRLQRRISFVIGMGYKALSYRV